MNTLEIVRQHEARHAAADSLLFNSAGFYWDESISRFVISVRGMIVATPKTLKEVKAFSAMHNDRLIAA